MTVKVVSISGGGKVVEPAPNQAPNRSDVNSAQKLGASAASAAQSVSSEAALSSVRTFRSNGISNEPIREYKKAKQVSQEIAEKVSEGGQDAKEAHSNVSEHSTKAHLLQ